MALPKCVGRAVIGALVLSACSSGKDDPSPETAALVAEAKALKDDQVEAKANEISQNDYRMFRSLMAAGGLDEELGGAAQGDAALRELMLKFRQQMLGARANLPRMVPVDVSPEVAGLLGLGESFFGAFVGTATLMSFISETDQPNVSFEQDRDGLSLKAAANDAEGRATLSTSATSEAGGLQGNMTTKVTLDFCPKIDGTIDLDFVSEGRLAKAGGTTSVNVKVIGKVKLNVSDNAELGHPIDMDIRVEVAISGGTRGENGSFVDYSEKTSSMNSAGDSRTVNRKSSKATNDDVSTAKAYVGFAQLLGGTIAYRAERVFQSGKCVKLEPTSDPTKRSGVKPKTSFAILAAPRSKIDGTPTGGSVKATLTGEGALDPADTKVPADAKFTYVAPDAKPRKGSIAFEARSKRGVGKATLSFDTASRAYSATGGSSNGQLRGSGNICSFGEPFVLTGSGVTQNFTPSSDTGGSYNYSGVIKGIKVYGKGTYTVKADDTGGTLTATGPGSVVTPMGVFTASDTETYKLTPIDSCG